jgi:hypothetical protein
MLFNVLWPLFFISFYTYYKEKISKRESPYLCYFVGFYLLVFSFIAHKEYRFLIPLMPFCFILIGYFLFRKVKEHPTLVKIIVVGSVLVEILTTVVMTRYHFRGWETMRDLVSLHPHSIYAMPRYDVNYYSWTHNNSQGSLDRWPKLYLGNKIPTYARTKVGMPLPILHDHDFNLCIELLDDLKRGTMIPEYMII